MLSVSYGKEDRVTQSERLLRREELRADEHAYADGRPASAGGRVKICAICGQVLKQRADKLWG
jgi:hypothetical protein